MTAYQFTDARSLSAEAGLVRPVPWAGAARSAGVRPVRGEGQQVINLVRRYPDSKPEDITDAFSRGVICGMEVWRGTCRLILHGYLADQPSIGCWSCDECSFGWHHSIYDKQFSYCPNCGRKAVDE